MVKNIKKIMKIWYALIAHNRTATVRRSRRLGYANH